MMQLAKKVPFDDPNVLNGVRAMYVLSNVIILSLYVYVSGQITKKNGKQENRVERGGEDYIADFGNEWGRPHNNEVS